MITRPLSLSLFFLSSGSDVREASFGPSVVEASKSLSGRNELSDKGPLICPPGESEFFPFLKQSNCSGVQTWPESGSWWLTRPIGCWPEIACMTLRTSSSTSPCHPGTATIRQHCVLAKANCWIMIRICLCHSQSVKIVCFSFHLTLEQTIHG